MEFKRTWGFPVTLVTGVLSILMLGVCSVSASEFVKVPRSLNCTVWQDCILNCTFNVTAGGGWDERSAVIWRRAETKYEVHVYINNRDQLEDQLPQYVNRTSLSDSELQGMLHCCRGESHWKMPGRTAVMFTLLNSLVGV
ncbi:UNVERIFIED_CONTAM: hypothetical protein FKN15_023206 [Acipenser sinensis]